MTLTIESRKYYRARDGRKVGPMERRESAMRRKMYMACKTSGRCYLEDGNGAHGTWDVARKRDFDLIAEWSDEDAELTQIAEDRRDGPFVPVDLDEPETGMPSGDGLLEEIGRVTREVISASDTIRCAECDCEDGGDDCNWIASDTHKTWGEMTDVEKGALLLAEHEGKTIQQPAGSKNEWVDIQEPLWFDDSRYRIKPEPKRETVTLYGGIACDSWFFSQDDVTDIGEDTHRITFDVVDGKPDCSSVRMEEV